MIRKLSIILLLGLVSFDISAQNDSIQPDTARKKIFFRANIADTNSITNQDAIYNRPFIGIRDSRTAVGGYLEGNTNYMAEDGVSEGFSMELRRFNIFLFSNISRRIKFLSELEFEHGTEEIAIETAQIDFELNQAFNFRAGILLPQIGIFNANHDSPNWEFIERPMSSTQIIPSTLSEVGFGIHGKLYPGNNIIAYNAYIVNGLQNDITLNSEGRTFIPAGKNEEMFGEDNNGVPMYNTRISVTNRQAGEIGVAYYGGVYNTFRIEGEQVEDRRMLSIFAVDFSGQIAKATVQGEYVYATVDVANDIDGLYGRIQHGGFCELIYPVLERPVLGYQQAKVNTSVRLELIDYNFGKFPVTGDEIRDEVRGLTVGLGFRPTPATVFRGNYFYHWQFDALGNPPARAAGFQFGFATYF